MIFSYFYFSLGYRPFMMLLQPQVTLLDRFVIQQESIPNLMPPIGARPTQMQFGNHGIDAMNNLVKNVSSSFSIKNRIYTNKNIFYYKKIFFRL